MLRRFEPKAPRVMKKIFHEPLPTIGDVLNLNFEIRLNLSERSLVINMCLKWIFARKNLYKACFL